jgi:hypothetical protein
MRVQIVYFGILILVLTEFILTIVERRTTRVKTRLSRRVVFLRKPHLVIRIRPPPLS